MKPIPKGTLCVYSNSVWRPISGVPGFSEVEKNVQFRAMLPDLKKGVLRKFKGSSFKVA